MSRDRRFLGRSLLGARGALLLALLGAACHNGSDAARTTVAAGQGVDLVQGIGGAAGTAVVLSPDALPAGATVKIFAGLLDVPAGFAAAGPAARIEFSAALAAGQSAAVTLPFDPCLVEAQGAVPDDIVVLVVAYDGPTNFVPPLVVDAGDETVEFEATTSVVVMALVPVGTRAPFPPLAGMSTHALVVDEDNAVWGWGVNDFGELGDGTRDLWSLPSLVPGLGGVVSIEAGDSFSVALMRDGTVQTWGANYAGQLGPRAASAPFDLPGKVMGLPCMTRISLGGISATVLALGRDGQLYSWGDNIDGQCGRSSLEGSLAPGVVPMIDDPVDFDISRHGLAALGGGGVVAWGQNFRGQLGLGTFDDVDEPTMVPRLEDEDIVAVAAGGQFSLALTLYGEVWAWGANDAGQLGDGKFVDRAEPAKVPVRDIIMIAASGRTALAVDVSGDVWTWGAGEFGQRGDGTFDAARAFPDRARLLPEPVVDVDAGRDAFLVVLADGRVYTWGRNHLGQLGDGTFFNRSIPLEIGSR